MPTKIIGPSDIFFNKFTSGGRKRNNIYRDLCRKGFGEIRERELPDKSRVILGYSDEASAPAGIAIKLNPDMSMKIKEYSSIYAKLPFVKSRKTIIKIFKDNAGNIFRKFKLDRIYEKDSLKTRTVTIEKNFGDGDYYRVEDDNRNGRTFTKCINDTFYSFSAEI